MSSCHVYLAPGFFGFTSLGTISYFHRVQETLREALRVRGVDAQVIECRTQPTGSLRRRAMQLMQEVVDTGGMQADRLHFIGHSTGGLDIRLLLTPGVQLRQDQLQATIAARTGHAVTVASPHYGTPLADFFTFIPGRQALQVFTRIATSRVGRIGLVAASRLVALLAGLDDWFSRKNFLDEISRRLLRHLTLHDDDPVFSFLAQVSVDQAAVIQVTPECMDLFNAAVTDHPDVQYSCVVTGAPLSPLSYRATDLMSAEKVALASVFVGISTLCARQHRQYPYPVPERAVLEELVRAIPEGANPATNDGIVPTLSQVHGKLVTAVVADHYDVIGQFGDAGDQPLGDWLPSGTGFDEPRFLAVWDRIADRLTGRG